VRLDKHRDSLAKYCYDLSKVTLAVAVINPVVIKTSGFPDLVVGLVVGVLFLLLAIFIERGGAP